jgi:hypothetical protein
MEFFKRILRVSPDRIGQVEKRLSKRYTLPETSPLQVWVTFAGIAIPARILNISSGGLRVVVDNGCLLPPKTPFTLTLQIEDMSLDLTVLLSNSAEEEEGLALGLKFEGNDFETRQSLVQLLEPIGVGASLSAVDPDSVAQTEPGLVALRYFSASSSTLTVWRSLADDQIQGFELRVLDYYVRNASEAPALEAYLDDSLAGTGTSGYAVPTLQRSSDISLEVRRFYNWIIPHLNGNIPVDVREYLGRYVSPV